MITRSRSLLVTYVLAALLVRADGTAQDVVPVLDATTPAGCAQGANDWRNKQMTAARAELTAGTIDAQKYNQSYTALMRQSQQLARTCAAQFDVERVPSNDLAALANLYTFIGDTARARRATVYALTTTDLSPRQQGSILSLAIQQELTRNSQYFGRQEAAERYVARIDALPD